MAKQQVFHLAKQRTMTKDIIEKLKNDLNFIKIKTSEKKLRKKQNEKDSLELQIQYLTKQMIEKYELLKYDLGIKMESHKTKFFILDVENIIRNQVDKD